MATKKKKKKKNIIDYKAGGKLGKRAVLDANKDGKLTAEDFRLLRERKKSEKKVPKAAVGMSLAALYWLLAFTKTVGAKKAAAAGTKALVKQSVKEGAKKVAKEGTKNVKIGNPYFRTIDLPIINKSKHKHYLEYYNKKSLDIVYDKYKKDFKYFNYKKI